MFKRLLVLVLVLAGSLAANAQGTHRISQVVSRATTGVNAQVVPYAHVLVCQAGTGCSSLATIYSNIELTGLPAANPVIADASGNYDYYVTLGCYDEQISAPGMTTFTISNVCDSVGGVIKIIAGNNITISPTGGTGVVTVNASGGGGCAQGTCVVNNPSGTQTVTQPASTTLVTNNINHYFLASQYQTGGGNNGIANAAALNPGTGETIISDPGYANTELLAPIVRGAGGYGAGNYLAMPTWPGLTHLRDQRAGFDINVFTAPTGTGSYYPSSTFVPFVKGNFFNSAYDVTIPGNTVSQNTYVNQEVFNGPGNQIAGFGGVNLKSYDTGPVNNFVASDQGQHLSYNTNMSVTGVGDVLGPSVFITCSGGMSAVNDEGCHLGDVQVGESNHPYQGTIASVTSATVQQDTVTSGAGDQGDGRYRIDTNAAKVLSGSWPTAYISGTTAHNNLAPPMENFTGSASFTSGWVGMVCDTAVDSCAGGVDPTGSINSVAGGYAPGSITFVLLSSAPSMRTGYSSTTSGLPSTGIACIADPRYFETTTYTVVDSTHITLNLRKPHFDGMTVGIGGECQTGLEVTGSTLTEGGTKFKQVFPVVGNFNTTQLIVFDSDPQQNYSNAVLANNSTSYCSTDGNLATFSNSGTTITVLDSGSNVPDQHFSGQTAVVTTPNGTYNGTVPITITSVYSGGVYLSAYQYTVGSTPSGSPPTSGSIQFCNTGYHVYPAAEVVSVLNPSTNAVDGYFSLAPNTINWQVGDTVEEPHYFWMLNAFSGGLYPIDQKLPRPPYNEWLTAGLNYSSLDAGSYLGWTIENSTPTSLYQGYGGTANFPQAAYGTMGLWRYGLELQSPPPTPATLGGYILKVDNAQPNGDPMGSMIGIYGGPGPNQNIWDNEYAHVFTFSDQGIQIGGGFPSTIYTPLFGTTAFSGDLGPSFTPDGTLEAENFQFYSTFSPPTHYLPLTMYGDGSTSIGMQFPSADGGVHPTYQGGTLHLGAIGLYQANTTSGVIFANLTTPANGQISFDDATPGDSGARLLFKSFVLNGGTAITGQSSANPQIVTCATGGTGTQVCDAAGNWIASGGGGSGTVNSGPANALTYYPAAAAAVSGDGNTSDDGAGNIGAKSFSATGTGAGGLNITEGTAPSGVASHDLFWGDSTAHRLLENANNAGSVILSGVASAGTSGHCTEFASNGIDLIDAGTACASGSGGFPITLGSTSIAASSTTTSVTGLTVDGVTPTTFGYLDATSSIQTQLNGKAALASANSFSAVNTFPGGDLFQGGIDAQTGTTYTMVAADENKLLTLNNAAAVAVTLPVATTTGFTSGAVFHVRNLGAGTATITPTTSTIDGGSSLALTTGQGADIYSDGTNYTTQKGARSSGSGFVALVPAATQTIAPTNTSAVPLQINAPSGISVDAFEVKTNGSDDFWVDQFNNTNVANNFSVGGTNAKMVHVVGNSSAPTDTAGTGAGTSPTITFTSATDLSGYINVTTGTGTPAASAAIVTVIFNQTYNSTAPHCSLYPGNAAAAALSGASTPYIASSTLTTAHFIITSNTTGLAASTAYVWGYTCTQ